MDCNCAAVFNQDCNAPDHEEQMRKIRTTLFDYMKCMEIEAMEEWE